VRRRIFLAASQQYLIGFLCQALIDVDLDLVLEVGERTQQLGLDHQLQVVLQVVEPLAMGIFSSTGPLSARSSSAVDDQPAAQVGR
jgi:hypothetical protein